MRRWAGMIAVALALGAGAVKAGDRAGDFDYYVLSLGWSATWCALTGDDSGDPQCDPGRKLTFTLHGLWPQYEQGYPSNCFTTGNDPSRAETAAMADIMGGAGLAWHEWQKHGRCSGLSSQDYFALSRQAYGAVRIPDLFQGVTRDLKVPARVIEQAFLEANPDLDARGITVTCQAGFVDEVRICLTRDLSPRDCGADVARDCSLPDADLPPVR